MIRALPLPARRSPTCGYGAPCSSHWYCRPRACSAAARAVCAAYSPVVMRPGGDRRRGRAGGPVVHHGRLRRPRHVRAQQQGGVLGGHGDGVAVGVAGDGGQRPAEHGRAAQGPVVGRLLAGEQHQRAVGRARLSAGDGGPVRRHHEPLGEAGQRGHVERGRAVPVPGDRGARRDQRGVLAPGLSPLGRRNDGEGRRLVARCRGRVADLQVGLVGGARVGEGNTVAGVGDRVRVGGRGAALDGQHCHGGQRRHSDRLGPALSVCHAKAGYRV